MEGMNKFGIGVVSILAFSVLNNILGLAIFILVTGFIVFANYILSLYACRISEAHPRKTVKQKKEFVDSLFPQNNIYYVFGKLIAYAGIMAACSYIDTFVGDIIPIMASFKTIIIVAEINNMENILRRGFGVNISVISKMINKIRNKTYEAVHSARHKKLQK